MMAGSESGSTVLLRRDGGAEGRSAPPPPPPPPPPPDIERKKTRYEVIIIGAGPAGYTAGIYCSRARHDTLLLSGPLPGGQLVNTTEVENYPGFKAGVMGPDLMADMREQSKAMGTTMLDEEVIDVDFRREPLKVLTSGEEYEADAVIICTGASPRKLGLDGESALAGRGVSYCATCDGPFFRDKDIVVVGGGDSAMEEATFLTKFSPNVHVVHRREELRASKIMQERAMANPRITMHLSCQVADIRGDGKVSEVVVRNSRTGQDETIRAAGVFVAIGHDPNTALFAGQVETDGDGYVVVRNGTETSAKGVFAAGDVHDRRYRQAITAGGFGCMAALDVNRYLDERAEEAGGNGGVSPPAAASGAKSGSGGYAPVCAGVQ